jgi:hypothetical protein
MRVAKANGVRCLATSLGRIPVATAEAAVKKGDGILIDAVSCVPRPLLAARQRVSPSDFHDFVNTFSRARKKGSRTAGHQPRVRKIGRLATYGGDNRNE